MKEWIWGFLLALALVGTTQASNVNVIVQSETTYVGAHNVVIGIRVINSTSTIVSGFSVPLEIRAGPTGSFITKVKLSYGNRLNNVLTGVVLGVHLADTNGTCISRGHHGYAGLAPDSSVGASPEAVMFVRAQTNEGPLPPGGDNSFATASMLLTVDVNQTQGTFDIDTTCIDPGNHLMFATGLSDAVLVDTLGFTKGTITITCNCPHQGDIVQNGSIDVQDVLQAIKVAFTNGADITDPTCPRSRCDFNGSGFADVNDVLSLIKTAFTNGPQPINPCQ